jgi:ParB family chromosome partitioning protein
MAQKKMKNITDEVKKIKLDDIKPPANPIRSKADEDKMEELIDSIRRFGLINPITVFPRGKLYEIFAGHRRFIACKAVGMEEIPANIRTADETQRDMIKLHENTVREDVNPIDQAHYFKSMIEKYNYTHDELANMIGKSRPYVSNIMRLLNYPEYVQEAIEKGDLTYNIANILMQIDDEGTRDMYISHAITGGLSQKTADEWVTQWRISKELQNTTDTPSGSQEPAVQHEYIPPKCFYCGMSVRDIPLEAILTCTRCKFNFIDIMKPQEEKKT